MRASVIRLIAALLALSYGSAGAAVFGLVDTGEIYTSANGGTTWTILAAIPASDAVGLVAGASTNDLFMITRTGSVYRSTNGGAAWIAVGAIAASDVAAFTINPDYSLVALTESGILFRSTDVGVTFTAFAGLNASGLVSLARGPLGRLYAVARTGEVYESQDQGATWTIVGAITVSNAVSIRRRGAELFILTRTGEVYRSLDYGRAWLPVGAITASNMSAILEAGSTLLAASETGEVYASASGAGWSAIGAIQQLRVMSLGSDTPLATGVAAGETPLPFRVRAPFPNPAPLSTGSRFAFETSRPERFRLELFDASGRRVSALHTERFASPGRSEMWWKPSGIAAGTYFVRVMSESGARAVVKWCLIE